MTSNQNPSQNPVENNTTPTTTESSRRFPVRTTTRAAAAGIAIVVLVFGVHTITSGGGEENPPERARPASAPQGADASTDEPSPVDMPGRDDDRLIREWAEMASGAEIPNEELTDARNPGTLDPGFEASDSNDVIASPTEIAAVTTLCLSVLHGEIGSEISASGEITGADGGLIWIQGPTFNGGEPVQIPVTAGVFDAPLPIVEYGNHEVTGFEVVPDGPDPISVDLLPGLVDGPGAVFPVGAENGPVFDSECFDFPPAAAAPSANDNPAADPVDGPSADPVDGPAVVTEAAIVQEFLDGFVEDHRAGDTAALLTTLHPAIPLSFGADVCTEYVNRTTGAIVGAAVLDVGQVGPLEMNTPAGPIGFPESIPFTVEFTLTNGTTMINDTSLPLQDGVAHWLTMCGVETP